MAHRETLSNKYLLISILMLIFVLCDLMFDFLFCFTGSNYVSFGFTLLATIFTFFGNYGVVKFEITHKTDKISVFVKSVFNLPQVVFSILDVCCGIISILSGLVIIGSVFKIAKLLFIPARIVTVANKGKTIFKAIGKFSLIWVIGRLLSNKYKGIIEMKKWIVNNKLTLASCIIGGPAIAYLVHLALPNWIKLALWLNILVSILVGALFIVYLVSLGGDKEVQAKFRMFSKKLKGEYSKNVIDFAEQLLGKQEIHEIALEEIAKREKQEQEAQSNEIVKLSEEEKNKLIEEEIQKIKNGN